MSDDMLLGVILGMVMGGVILTVLSILLSDPILTDEHRIILWEHCYTQYETPAEVRDCLTELGLAVE